MIKKNSNEREKIKRMLRDDPVTIGHWIGFKDLTELHNEWLKEILYGSGDYTLLAHRGSYKTSTLELALALFPLIHPDLNLIYVRKTDSDVADVCRTAQKIIKTGALQGISRILYGHPLQLTKESATSISTNINLLSTGTPQIVGLGLGTSITGRHSSYVISDDIVTIKDRVSRAEREATIRGYMELQNIKNRGDGCRIINLGTPWHKEDAISRMPNIHKYDCYSTGLIKPVELQSLREQMTASLFAANYELKHIADEDAIFKNPSYWNEEESEKIRGGTAHIDAAYGGGDWTAYTIMRETDGIIYATGRSWHKPADAILEELLHTHYEYDAGLLLCEDNADKGYLARDFRNLGLQTKTYHESMNKYVKITTFLKKEWHRIKWDPETDPDYMDLILDYNDKSAHDDAPDSAASLIRYLTTQSTVSTNKTLIGGF